MVKCKASFKLGDLVSFQDREFYIIAKEAQRVKLKSIDLNESHSITVPLKLIRKKLPWRESVRVNDVLQVLVKGKWVLSHVHSVDGSMVKLQPFYTRVLLQKDLYGGAVRTTDHVECVKFQPYESDVQYVKYQNDLQVVQAEYNNYYILFPWKYVLKDECEPYDERASRIFIGTYTFDNMETEYPHSVLASLDKERLMQCLLVSESGLLQHIAGQYLDEIIVHCPHASCVIHDMVYLSMAKGDFVRIDEIMGLSPAEYISGLSVSHVSVGRSYIDMDVTFDNGAMTFSMYALQNVETLPTIARHILLRLSHPQNHYKPLFVNNLYIERFGKVPRGTTQELEAELEAAGVDSEMDSEDDMDDYPSEEEIISAHLMHKDTTNISHLMTLQHSMFHFNNYTGISKSSQEITGGFFRTSNMGEERDMVNLCKKIPKRTLVITNQMGLSPWVSACKDLLHPYIKGTPVVGSFENLPLMVISTFEHVAADKHNFKWMGTFERVIVVGKCNQEISTLVNELHINTRWVIGNFETTPHVLGTLGVYPFNTYEVPDIKKDDKSVAEQFLEVTKSLEYHVSREWEHVPRNLVLEDKAADALFSFSKDLVSVTDYSKIIETPKGTLQTIKKRYKLKQGFDERLKGTCAICMESFTNPTTTSCGHIFCKTCAADIQQKDIPCPLCRTDIKGFMEISDEDTPGEIFQKDGKSYLVPEVKASEKMEKIRRLVKKHNNAVIISKHDAVVDHIAKSFDCKPTKTHADLKDALSDTCIVTSLESMKKGLRFHLPVSQCTMITTEDITWSDTLEGLMHQEHGYEVVPRSIISLQSLHASYSSSFTV